MWFCALYILSIVAVNIAFAWLPLVFIAGSAVPTAAPLAGVVFLVRDLAQRYCGHWVLALMALGLGLSWCLASSAVAAASGVAFVVSEVLDWGVYTVSGGSLRRRVVLSSLVAVPVDTALFLVMAFGWSAVTGMSIVSMSVAKLLPLLLVRRLLVRRL